MKEDIDTTPSSFQEDQRLMEQARFSRPLIYDQEAYERAIANGFQAVTITLNGGVRSDLKWEKERHLALEAIHHGLVIMWKIELGLFSQLSQPIRHQAQFLSLTLSLEHFRDTLWKEFQAHSIGVCLFQGSVDFTIGFEWDPHQEHTLQEWLQEKAPPHLASLSLGLLQLQEEGRALLRLFCRDVAIEYIRLLATRIPDALPVFLYLDATAFSHSPSQQLQLLHPQCFERFQLVVKGQTLPFPVLGWEHPTSKGYCGHHPAILPLEEHATLGICLPDMEKVAEEVYRDLENAIFKIEEASLSFKMIPEDLLTAQWDGLDYLIYHPETLSIQGKRKLQGFCAAGGTVISLGEFKGFSQEISLNDAPFIAK